MSYQKIAGIALILVTVLVIGVWVILFLIGNPSSVTWKDTFDHMLLPENEMQNMFYASVASVIISSISAIIYFSKLSQSKNILMFLLFVCAIQAIPATWLLSWDLKIMYLIPVLFGYLAYKHPNKSLKNGTREKLRAP